MDSIVVVTTTFSAAHCVANHPVCGERHGHTWTVRVELAVEEAYLEGAVDHVRGIIGQFHRTDLDRYLPGVETTCSGLAANFHERLYGLPVSAIEVSTEDLGVKLIWSVR